MSATTEALRRHAEINVGFTVEPVSAWHVACSVCDQNETISTAGRTRRRVVRLGADWMVSHRLTCPGGPEKRSDRK